MLYPTSLPTRVELQMNVVGDLSMQKHMEDKTFLFCHFLKKKSLCFIVYIVTLLLEFVPSCPMYWCIFRLYVVESYQEKNAWLLGKKSLCLCAYGLVFQPVLWFSFCFHLLPPIRSTISVMKLALYCLFLFFHFALFSWLILWNLTREKNLPILCCDGYGHAGY